MMTILDLARHLGVAEGMVRGIDKAHLRKTFGKPRLPDLEVIAFDEIYVGKKNRFFTTVVDWQSGAIVCVCESKGEEALNRFWKSLRAVCQNIRNFSARVLAAQQFGVRAVVISCRPLRPLA